MTDMARVYIFFLFSGFLIGSISTFFARKYSLGSKELGVRGVPFTGGIAIGLSLFILCLLGFPFHFLPRQVAGILVSSFLMLVFGFVDDLLELSIPAKFLVQIVSVAVLILSGVKAQIAYLGIFFNILVTVIWILGITNAFNHLDVIDGLAGSVALIIGSSFFVISLFNQDIVSALLSLAIVGSAGGFLIFNLPPAKIYMGNSGSHFLGFLLGAVALIISYAPKQRSVALLSPLLVLGFPIMDTAFLIILRLQKRISPFKKSNDHPALRFLALGYSRQKSLVVMSAFCLFFALCGIIVSQAPNLLGILVVFCAGLSGLSLFVKIRRAKVYG